MDIARRSFLRGRPGRQAPLRPPWALLESDFTTRCTRCTRCGDCVSACPTGLLQSGDDGFPFANFASGTCDFCAHCVEACPSGALLRRNDPPWNLVASIGDACLARQDVVCRTCGEACDAEAIRFTPRIGGVAIPELNTERCTGCGDCLAGCPTRAIAIARAPTSRENA